MKKALIALLSLALLTGCSDWERTTFQTLSASKATIDQAQTDYEVHTLPHTQCAYAIINDAKAAQTVSVNAMVAYEGVKAAKGNEDAQKAVVVGTLANLGGVIAQVKNLYSNPAACGGAK